MKIFLVAVIAAGCLSLAGCASVPGAERADRLESEIANMRGDLLRLKQENEILALKAEQAEAGLARMQATVEQKDTLLEQQQRLIEAMEVERREMRDLLEREENSLE